MAKNDPPKNDPPNVAQLEHEKNAREALMGIIEKLRPFSEEDRQRIIRAVAVFYDCEAVTR